MTSMPESDALERLRAVPLFHDVSARALDRLLAISRRESVPEGTVLFRQGAHGDEMVLLLNGSLRVSVAANGHELCLAIAQPGEVLGEMALIDGAPRSATVVAEEPCDLLVLDRSAFLSLVREEPDIALSVMQCLTSRLREVTEQVTDIAHLDVYQRLLHQLRRLSLEHGETSSEGIVIRHRLSADTLSKMIAVERGVVERFLSLLENEGALRTTNDHIIIPDLDKLSARTTPLMY